MLQGTKEIPFHVSSGGVVYRKKDNKIEIILLHRDKTDTYHLPKGTVEDNESLEVTAKREIHEETGYDVELKSYLGFLNSEFERDNAKIKKVTNYFLFTLIDEKQNDFIKEHDQVLWVEISKAKELVLKNRLDWMEKENEMVKRAELVLSDK
ncbi:MAG: NUDIX domain-containing protein [Patescibacteria group bacterium]|jgi:8-oxo-dGTP diphosphatase